MDKQSTGRGIALLPIVVFLGIYIGSGIYFSIRGVDFPFNQMPIIIPIVMGVIVSILINKGPISDRFDAMVKGAADVDLMTMCVILLLAGAFSSLTTGIGGVESVANLCLSFIPPEFMVAGLFLIAAILSLATGTSMGTISTIVPIAIEVAGKSGLNMGFTLAAMVGGAMFGDNLSVISDVAVVSTRTQRVEPGDRLKVNALIAVPAAICAFVMFLLFSPEASAVEMGNLPYNPVLVIPYLVVLALALKGFSVFGVLGGGIASAIIIGLFFTDTSPFAMAVSVYDGMLGMGELIILAIWMGGLIALIVRSGGIEFLLDRVGRIAKTRKSAELCVCALVSFADIAVANNTLAILMCGDLSRRLSAKYRIDPRKTASLLGIFSCIMQGMIPYSGQILVAISIANAAAGYALSPFDLIPYMWYQFILTIFGLLAVLVPSLIDSFLKRNPWDWEHNMTSKQYAEIAKTHQNVP